MIIHIIKLRMKLRKDNKIILLSLILLYFYIVLQMIYKQLNEIQKHVDALKSLK